VVDGATLNSGESVRAYVAQGPDQVPTLNAHEIRRFLERELKAEFRAKASGGMSGAVVSDL
jgi:hypothetical protein